MIGFSPHYVEAVPGLFAAMQKSRIVALEEPRTPGFQAMLSGNMPIDDYLLQVDTGFPEFAARMCQALQILWRQGVRIEQVDPYLDRLVTINECFADQKPPADVMAQPELRAVYLAEKEATGALIAFYDLSRGENFAALAASVVRFARMDAERIRLRDTLRTQAVCALAASGEPLFVESGYLHHGLLRQVSRFAGAARFQPHATSRSSTGFCFVRAKYILQPAVHRLRAKARNMGPGEILTLLFTLRPTVRPELAELLAARSLIAIQLAAKEELLPTSQKPFPHSEEDARINTIVRQLDFAQCRILYPRLRGVPRRTALRYAQQAAWETPG